MDDKLLKALGQYNQYMLEHLKKLDDFDVWYEEFFHADFPKGWYDIINSSKA